MGSASTLFQSAFAGFTQSTRLLRLSTPLGQDTLLAECVRGEESLAHGFSFAVSALSTDAQLPLKSLIGQPALLELLTAHSRTQLRPFHGHLTAVEHCGANGGFARYRLTLEPWTAFLKLGRDSRVFQNMTVFDIIDAIFAEYQGKGRLMPEWRFDIAERAVYPVRSLTTQYQESNFAFVTRLMAEEGLFHYFEHAGERGSATLGRHSMVIADHNGTFKPNQQPRLRYTQSGAVMKEDGIDRWQTHLREQTSALDMSSWDYRALSQRPVGAADTAGSGAPPASRETLGTYAYQTRQQGQRMADHLMQGLAARKQVQLGAGTVRTLSPGTTFTLHGQAQCDAAQSDEERTFLIVRTVHLMHNNLSAAFRADVETRLKPSALSLLMDQECAGKLHRTGRSMQAAEEGERPLYRNRIDVIPSCTPYRTCVFDHEGRMQNLRPTIRGQQTAIVVGPAGSVVHTDRDHRIKVQFHWQRGAQSHSRLDHPHAANHSGAPADDSAGSWVRVAATLAPMAGENWGGHAVPRVGQEVLVDFTDGDIDRPVVIGVVYNGKGATDAQHNQFSNGAGSSTGNAPPWFPGERGAHAHPAVLSGIKTQCMSASQHGAGAYSQLVMDDTAGQSRLSLQRHASAQQGTDELNLGSLHHQSDNQRLAPAGHGAELKSVFGAALRAGRGMLLSADARANASGAQLDAREAVAQMQASHALQQSLAKTAQQHNAKLKGEAAPDKLPAIAGLATSISVVGSVDEGEGAAQKAGGASAVPAYTKPHLQFSSPAGIVAATPASMVWAAGQSTSISAGQDVNILTQGNLAGAVLKGISLFTYGKANAADKPNQETGIKFHAACGKFSCQSQSGVTRLTADKTITVASVAKSVTIASPQKHVLFTAQGACLKLEGGNIMLHGPGKIEFKASQKELAGPKSTRIQTELPKPGDVKVCELRAAGAAAAGDSVVPLI